LVQPAQVLVGQERRFTARRGQQMTPKTTSRRTELKIANMVADRLIAALQKQQPQALVSGSRTDILIAGTFDLRKAVLQVLREVDHLTKSGQETSPS
jgi:hypothetical protein